MKSTKLKKVNQIQNATLPDDIIFEHILLKLPLKHLIRFKSVSKTWLSKISNISPQFAKSHLKLFPSPSPQFLVVSGNQQNPLFTIITFDEHGRIAETLNLGFIYNYTGPIHVVGCYNNLVCLADQQYHKFAICNPVTRHCNEIPAPKFDHFTVISAGFGYVSSVNDYKIVCLVGLPNDDHDDADEAMDLIAVYIYSSTVRNWKKLSVVGNGELEGRVTIFRGDVPVLMDDTLYWFASRVVFKVNLVKTGVFGTIPFFHYVFQLPIPYKGAKVFKIDEELSILFDGRLWSLEENGSGYQLCNFNSYKGDKYQMLSVCETTGEWLVLNHNNMVGLFDSKRNFIRTRSRGGSGIRFRGPIFYAWDFKMSLVPPMLE